MIVVVTSIRLKSLWKFFALSRYALDIRRQLKGAAGCQALRTRGFGRNHFTLSLWSSHDEMRAFVRSGAHALAMRQSGQLASEIKTFSYSSEQLPGWAEARSLLDSQGKILRYD